MKFMSCVHWELMRRCTVCTGYDVAGQSFSRALYSASCGASCSVKACVWQHFLQCKCKALAAYFAAPFAMPFVAFLATLLVVLFATLLAAPFAHVWEGSSGKAFAGELSPPYTRNTKTTAPFYFLLTLHTTQRSHCSEICSEVRMHRNKKLVKV